MKHLASGLIKARGLPRIFHRALACLLERAAKQTQHCTCVHVHTRAKIKKNSKSPCVLILAAPYIERLGRLKKCSNKKMCDRSDRGGPGPCAARAAQPWRGGTVSVSGPSQNAPSPPCSRLTYSTHTHTCTHTDTQTHARTHRRDSARREE